MKEFTVLAISALDEKVMALFYLEAQARHFCNSLNNGFTDEDGVYWRLTIQ